MRHLRIHLDQLVTFYFVATERSFTAAAEALCVTQPAVTAQLRSLEEAYGVKLVLVRRKRAQLTAEGELLLPLAAEVYRAALRAEDLLESHGRAKTLRLGVAPALAGYLAQAVAVFGGLYPSVRVIVREAPSLKLLEGLREFKHDLCFVGAVEDGTGDLRVHHLRHTDRMMLVAAPDHPLAHRGPVTWEDLSGCPLVLHGEGSLARKVILEEFGKRGLHPRIAAEVDSVAYVKQLVEGRGAVALIFSPNIDEEVAQQRLTVLPWTAAEFQIGVDVVLRRETAESPACTAFLKVMRQHFGDAFDFAG